MKMKILNKKIISMLPSDNDPPELKVLRTRLDSFTGIINKFEQKIADLRRQYEHFSSLSNKCSEDNKDGVIAGFLNRVNGSSWELQRKKDFYKNKMEGIIFLLKIKEKVLVKYQEQLRVLRKKIATYNTKKPRALNPRTFKSTPARKVTLSHSITYLCNLITTGYRLEKTSSGTNIIKNGIVHGSIVDDKNTPVKIINATSRELRERIQKAAIPIMDKVVCSLSMTAQNTLQLITYPYLTREETRLIKTRLIPEPGSLLVHFPQYSIIRASDNVFRRIGTHSIGEPCWGALIYDPVNKIAAVGHRHPGESLVDISMIKTMIDRMVYKGANPARLVFIGSANIRPEIRELFPEKFAQPKYNLPRHFLFDLQTLSIEALSLDGLSGKLKKCIAESRKKNETTRANSIRYYEV
ncbi:hypothetical protein ACFL4D_00165 [Candidatus Margulisiibacteriota bacterium]